MLQLIMWRRCSSIQSANCSVTEWASHCHWKWGCFLSWIVESVNCTRICKQPMMTKLKLEVKLNLSSKIDCKSSIIFRSKITLVSWMCNYLLQLSSESCKTSANNQFIAIPEIQEEQTADSQEHCHSIILYKDHSRNAQWNWACRQACGETALRLRSLHPPCHPLRASAGHHYDLERGARLTEARRPAAGQSQKDVAGLQLRLLYGTLKPGDGLGASCALHHCRGVSRATPTGRRMSRIGQIATNRWTELDFWSFEQLSPNEHATSRHFRLRLMK